MNRRKFIQQSAAITSLSVLAAHCASNEKLKGSILGASAHIGHMLRDKKFEEPAVSEKKKIVIVGAGVSGLTAAWHLQRSGITDFVLLDIEREPGGNAAHGTNAVSGFPLGAHYVPVPNNDLTEYIKFLRNCGVVEGFDEKGLPIYNDYHICREPEERLYINGRWQEGLIPTYGVPPKEIAQLKQFLQLMNQFRYQRGSDGKDAFAIPVNNSSTDEIFRQLDALTMKEWLQAQSFTSSCLHWYVDYCTRDDFGTPYDQCSAWAGIHYFASRKGKAQNAVHSDVLTWPEGNGFLVKHLAENIREQIRNQCLVTSVRQHSNAVRITYFDVNQQQLKAIDSSQCLLAVPQFVTARLLKDAARLSLAEQHLHYAPWMVANIVVDSVTERSGLQPSWDNVIYGSSALGYVDATHQLLEQLHPRRNLTYYWPLTDRPVKEARKWAQEQTHESWAEMIFNDLQVIHPDIRSAAKELNVMVWGHAMAQPLPGLIFGEARPSLARSVGSQIHFAHTDLAGISIFEEAFYQGLSAAKKIQQLLS